MEEYVSEKVLGRAIPQGHPIRFAHRTLRFSAEDGLRCSPRPFGRGRLQVNRYVPLRDQEPPVLGGGR